MFTFYSSIINYLCLNLFFGLRQIFVVPSFCIWVLYAWVYIGHFL